MYVYERMVLSNPTYIVFHQFYNVCMYTLSSKADPYYSIATTIHISITEGDRRVILIRTCRTCRVSFSRKKGYGSISNTASLIFLLIQVIQQVPGFCV